MEQFWGLIMSVCLRQRVSCCALETLNRLLRPAELDSNLITFDGTGEHTDVSLKTLSPSGCETRCSGQFSLIWPEEYGGFGFLGFISRTDGFLSMTYQRAIIGWNEGWIDINSPNEIEEVSAQDLTWTQTSLVTVPTLGSLVLLGLGLTGLGFA